MGSWISVNKVIPYYEPLARFMIHYTLLYNIQVHDHSMQV